MLPMSDMDSVAADAFLIVLKRLSPSQRRAVLSRILSDETLAPEVAEALENAPTELNLSVRPVF
jgi:hypothetical protein